MVVSWWIVAFLPSDSRLFLFVVSRLQLYDTNTGSYLRSITQSQTPETQIVVCLLPTNKRDLYDSIKKHCCNGELPVPSQCLVAKTLFKKERVMSVATKIALQMNMKLGGEAWSTDIPLTGLMICGIDTYHDSQVRGRSVGAFVASLNKSCTHYFSKTLFQTGRQELLDGLTSCFTGKLWCMMYS